MNTRIYSVVAVVTLLTLVTGCSGTRNFLFGRGERCGACNNMSDAQTPSYDTTLQTPCGTSYSPNSTCNQNLATSPQNGCGCNSGCNTYGDSQGLGCGGNCGGVAGGVTGEYADPYLPSNIIPSNGQVIPGTVGNGIDDGFQARRFDERGDLIVSEGPYVPAPAANQ